jgi:hypothetical protein
MWWRSRSRLVIWLCARAVVSPDTALTMIEPAMNFCKPPWILAWKLV